MPVAALLFALVLIPAANAYASEISVTVNGQPVVFADQNPEIVDGRTLVPVAGVFQALGFEVEWNHSERQAVITKGSDTVLITIGSSTFTRNGVDSPLDVPAQIINGRTMLPIAAVLQSLDYNVDWDGENRTVVIAESMTTAPPAPEPIIVPDEPEQETAEEPEQATDEPETAEEPVATEAPESAPMEQIDDGMADFISHFDLDVVRDILGTDFEIDAQEFSDGTLTWRSLNLSLPHGLQNLDIGDNSDRIASSEGEIFIVIRRDGPFLYIDLGAPDNSVLAQWAEEDGMSIAEVRDKGFRAYAIFPLN